MVLALLMSTISALDAVDVGFETLFHTQSDRIEGCLPFASSVPLNGTFIIPSAAQFEMGDEKLQGLLDAYGKLHRFTFSRGNLCFKGAMMGTVFYNLSGKCVGVTE